MILYLRDLLILGGLIVGILIAAVCGAIGVVYMLFGLLCFALLAYAS